jgi:hypothetical protein
VELLGALDERRWVGEETSSSSNSPWLKYVSVAQRVRAMASSDTLVSAMD